MNFIGNRSFILLKPKKPFVNWINEYDESKIPEENILSERTLYMVKEIEEDSPSVIKKLIKDNYKQIFIHALWSWYTDEDYLPKEITFKMFNEWFDYEFIEMCYDTLDGPVVLE